MSSICSVKTPSYVSLSILVEKKKKNDYCQFYWNEIDIN